MGESEARDAEVVAPPTTFEAFFLQERDRLFGLMCLVTGNRSDAEEIVQDAFLKMWERWDRRGALENPAGYLHTTAMNEVRKRYRRSATLRRILPRLSSGRDRSEPADTGVLLSAALRELEPRRRGALVLTELLGFSAEEAARTMGVKASTIGALKYQARTKLKKMESDDA